MSGIGFGYQFRRDTAALWTSGNPVLRAGELGLETDTAKFKFGDGTTTWITLVYSGGSGGSWGAITGTLSAQTDLQNALNLKATLASPTFTGVPAAPTAAPGTNTTQLATTAFVTAAGAATGITALTGDVTATGPGSVPATIAPAAVTLAKQANLAANAIIGNNTGVAATPLALTAAQVKALLAVSLTADVTGVLQAAQFPALTGDVTTTAGALATTIAPAAVTLAKQANVATGTVFYRTTAAAGAPEVQPLATLKTDLGLTGANSGDQTITLTSDVTGTGTGSFATTIAAGAVSLSKMANLAATTILGNNTGIAATPLALTPAQINAMLPVLTSALNGLAPASGGGAVNFLRADGTWQAPSGAAGITALTGDVTATGPGSVPATIAPAAVTLAKMADVATASVFYRKTAAAGAPEVQTLAVLKTDLGLTGTNSGDQTITLTGDVTGTGTGSFAATIAAAAVTLAKMANVATGSVFYRTTAAAGVPEVQTLAVLKTDLGLTGTNSGDQTITLTGDVTGTGTGSFAATVAANAVTLAKMAQVVTATFLGRTTAATGNVEALTVAQAKTLLAISLTSDVSGVLQAAQEPAPTGDVTNTAGSLALTIGTNVVGLNNLAQIASNRIMGRTTPTTGNIEVLTTTQVKTMLVATIRVITLTADTVVLTDAQNYLQTTSGTAVAITIPPNSSVAFPVGSLLSGEQGGAGTITLTAGAGVTLNSRGAALNTAGLYAVWQMKKTATDIWTVFGDLA